MRAFVRSMLLAGALGGVALAVTPSRAHAEKRWANVWPFPDCVYSCGNNIFHPQCTCVV